MQPSGKSRVTTKAADFAEKLYEGLLSKVFSLRDVMSHTKANRIHATIVALVQLFEIAKPPVSSMVKDQVSALETDVLADTPDSKQVAAHTNALLKHLGMMSKMHGGSKAGKKKMAMKM